MHFFYLVLAVFCVCLAISLIWTTLATGISPVMSTGKAREAMLTLVECSATGPFVDMGSGWGTLLVALAKKYPRQRVIGYELSCLPWLVSVLRKHALGLANLEIHRRDFRHADLTETAVMFCYLFPGGMQSIAEKLQRDQKVPMTVISNTFALPCCTPSATIKLPDLYRTPVYLYDWTGLPSARGNKDAGEPSPGRNTMKQRS